MVDNTIGVALKIVHLIGTLKVELRVKNVSRSYILAKCDFQHTLNEFDIVPLIIILFLKPYSEKRR